MWYHLPYVPLQTANDADFVMLSSVKLFVVNGTFLEILVEAVRASS